MDLNAWFLVITVLMPFLGAYFVLVLRRWPNAREFETILQSVILLGGVVAILLLLGSRRTREVSP